MDAGWHRLVNETVGVRAPGGFSIAAYSEFMPPPRIGIKPSGAPEYESPFSADDPWGWKITAREQEHHIGPGLHLIGRQLVETIVSLATGRGAHRIGNFHLNENLWWPKALHGVSLSHERYVFLSPLALSKTQDDKGRVRWTLFGASHHGPARAFWRSFFSGPDTEIPAAEAIERIRALVCGIFHLQANDLSDLKAAGFRIRPSGDLPDRSEWSEGPLPKWTQEFLLDAANPESCRYLLTFTPFAFLPLPVQQGYLAGKIHLLPSPASMVFWGSPLIGLLSRNLPFADQILLLHSVARHEGKGTRVPQSGWLHHRTASHPGHDPRLGDIRDTMRRTHRWQRVLRHDDDTVFAREDQVHAALFSTHPDDVRLYGKPMARNAQIWSSRFEPVLHGPAAGRNEIEAAIRQMEEGGSFGYRMFYPPMQVGRSAVFWHRPLIAFWNGAAAEVLDCGLHGFLAATESAVELWPRVETDISSAVRPAARNGAVGDDEAPRPSAGEAVTFRHTATRAFELRYWKTIADLASGQYLNKNSGDCVRDSVTQAHLRHHHSDLDALAEYLLDYYRRLARRAKMAGRVGIGDLPFRWQTDFAFPWMGGWLENEQGRRVERDLLIAIPGRNRGEAVIMADHYDTAYMEDVYGDRPGVKGDGARLAAAGADDNHSATAALMLGARIFLELSRRAALDCDIWLVHLTGEEFPADCLGARAFTERLIERTLKMRSPDGRERDLSQTNIRGAYVLDMIAHNNDHAPDIFQIAPGTTSASLWLAEQADAAARSWAAGVAQWNATARSKLGRGIRSSDPGSPPPIARYLAPKGEIRRHDHPRSTLYNTDGQIFSDAGIPVVLFMENYDINREGYHDTHDTLANIDLDYGSAFAAITIEAVARTAMATRS